MGDIRRNGALERSAFTLIELLVVVAIIALLISILLPSLSRAKQQARQVVDLTNVREQGKAANYYAQENKDLLGRGIQFGKNSQETEATHIFATTILKYLGYEGDPIRERLWREPNPSWYEQRKLRKVFAAIPQFQCPDYPTEAHDPQGNTPGYNGGYAESGGAPIRDQYLDFSVSAMPIPYAEGNIRYDLAHTGPPGDDYESIATGDVGYEEATKLDDIAAAKNPAELIYVTEANLTLRWNDYTFHTFFVGAQLPFGLVPRMANDQRHPGGLSVLFFDGHAAAMFPTKIDPGWDKPLGQRLRWFTRVDREDLW